MKLETFIKTAVLTVQVVWISLCGCAGGGKVKIEACKKYMNIAFELGRRAGRAERCQNKKLEYFRSSRQDGG